MSNIWFGHRIDVGNVRWIKNSFRFKEMHLFTVEQRIRWEIHTALISRHPIWNWSQPPVVWQINTHYFPFIDLRVVLIFLCNSHKVNYWFNKKTKQNDKRILLVATAPILLVNVETIKHSLITTSLQTPLNAGRSTLFVHLCRYKGYF